jgi:hypothetical protein
MHNRLTTLPIAAGLAVTGAVTCSIVLAEPPSLRAIDVGQLQRVLGGETIAECPEAEFTEEFFLEDCSFTPRGRNSFFSLEPEYQLHLAGIDEGKRIELFITALDQAFNVVMTIGGRTVTVRTRVVEEREFIDGELYEISRNFYARCRGTNDVFYFGEDVCFYQDGQCVDTGGSWRAGVDGATPGIIMPGRFLLGARYDQEQAPGVALDRAEHAEMGLTLDLPAGRFEDCVRVLETSALEPGAESEKFYCPGIGLVKDGVLELVSYGFVDDDDDDDDDSNG